MENLNPSPFLSESFLAVAATGMEPSAVARRLGFKPSELKAWISGAKPAPEEALTAIRAMAPERIRPNLPQFRFIDLFAGIGGMRRAFESAGGECVFTAEWNTMSLRTYLANHGAGHPVAGDITKVPAAMVPDHDVLVAGFPCFPEGTLIETDVTPTPIEEIKAGDMVATHRRRLRKVLSVMKREGAPLYEVKVTGVPSFKTTDEHPFYVRRRSRKFNSSTRRYDYTFGKPEWVAAKDLDGECFAALPMDDESSDFAFAGRTKEFWYLVGRWLGDGWLIDHPRTEKGREHQRVKKTIICTGSSDADSLLARIHEAGFRATPAPEKTVVKFHICSHELTDFLSQFGKGAAGKYVPRWLFSAPKWIQAEVWKGWLDSDGFKFKDSETYEGTTVSRSLAYGLARLARNAQGRIARVRRSRVARTTVVEGRTVNQKTQYKVTLPIRSQGFIGDGFAWSRVKSVKATQESATVYNFEVEEDNSYVAEGIVVHNCQPFSSAGVSKKNSMGRPHGFADETQGTLFFDVARIIDEKRPRAFLLENVKNLLSHDKGRTFEVIRRTLADELGYAVSFRLMDGSAWVPQKRVRIAIVGFRDGPAFDFDTVDVPASGPKLSSILHAAGEPGAGGYPYAPGGIPLPKYTLTDGLWSFLKAYAAKHEAKGNGFGYGLVGPDDVARTISARYGKDGSEILIEQPGRNPRRLTPRECARLMGFDRPGQEPMLIPVSDTQAYRQFGNSVVVPCFSAVASAMAKRLEQGETNGLKAA